VLYLGTWIAGSSGSDNSFLQYILVEIHVLRCFKPSAICEAGFDSDDLHGLSACSEIFLFPFDLSSDVL
jgi:hypothetical protein